MTDLPADTIRTDDNGRLRIDRDHTYALSRTALGHVWDVHEQKTNEFITKGCMGRTDALVILDGEEGARRS